MKIFFYFLYKYSYEIPLLFFLLILRQFLLSIYLILLPFIYIHHHLIFQNIPKHLFIISNILVLIILIIILKIIYMDYLHSLLLSLKTLLLLNGLITLNYSLTLLLLFTMFMEIKKFQIFFHLLINFLILLQNLIVLNLDIFLFLFLIIHLTFLNSLNLFLLTI